MPTILIVEDDVGYREEIQRALLARKPNLNVLFATFLREVPGLIGRGNIDLIVWDERLPDGRASDEAISKTSQTFRGPMIANGGMQKTRNLQLQAGCTHTKGANELISLILELLAEIA